jgi:hypothetical protein
VTFPNVVALLLDFFDGTLSDVAFVNDVPNPRPERFVQLRRIGGPAIVPVRDQPLIDVRSWDPLPARAMDTLLEVRSGLWSLNGRDDLGVQVYRLAETVGPRQTNDQTTGTPIAWLSVAMTIRADDVVPYS